MTESKGVGRGRKGIPRGRRQYGMWLKGEPQLKLCKGPLHAGGKLLPANDNFFFRLGPKNTFHAPCKECRRFKNAKDKNRKNYGYIPCSRIMFIFRELERRIGRKETERRLGYGSSKMSMILNKKQRYVQKETARKAMDLLKELRRTGEVRTREEIKYGRHRRLTKADESAKLAS